MTQKRISPFEVEKAHVKKIEKANNNSVDSVEYCPICSTKMRVLDANGILANVCIPHRIALPTENQ
jgi:hypothetical protein